MDRKIDRGHAKPRRRGGRFTEYEKRFGFYISFMTGTLIEEKKRKPRVYGRETYSCIIVRRISSKHNGSPAEFDTVGEISSPPHARLTAWTACRFRSPRVKSTQGRVSARGVNDLGRKFRARSCERNNDDGCDRSHARVPACALRIMSLLFSFSARAISLSPCRWFVRSRSVVPFYSDRSLHRAPLRPSFFIDTRSGRDDDDGGGRVLAEITNSLATNNFHSAPPRRGGVISHGLYRARRDRYIPHIVSDISAGRTRFIVEECEARR